MIYLENQWEGLQRILSQLDWSLKLARWKKCFLQDSHKGSIERVSIDWPQKNGNALNATDYRKLILSRLKFILRHKVLNQKNWRSKNVKGL